MISPVLLQKILSLGVHIHDPQTTLLDTEGILFSFYKRAAAVDHVRTYRSRSTILLVETNICNVYESTAVERVRPRLLYTAA